MQYLRKANENDIDLIYKWANDAIVRDNSFNSNPIPYEDHIKWFDCIIHSNNVLQFILMDDDIAVGQIRLNVKGESAEIGYSVAAEYRGKGYGHTLLRLIVKEVHENHSEIKRLIAKVKPDNNASKKLFESEGFDRDYICYSFEKGR